MDNLKKYLNIFFRKKFILTLIFIVSVATSLLGIASTYFGGLLIDRLIESTYISDMYTTFWIYLIIILLGVVFRFSYPLIITPTKEKFIYDFKIKILSQDNSYNETNISYLSKRIDEDTRQVTNFFVDNFSMAIIKVIETAVVSILVFHINWYVGIVMIIVCPIYFGLYKIFKHPIFNKSLQVKEKSATFFGDYTNELEKTNFEESFIQKSFLGYLKNYISYILVSTGLSSTQGLIMGLVQVGVFFIGSISVITGSTSIGLLSILMMYFNQVIGNIGYYLDLGRQWQVTNSSIYRIDELLKNN